MPTRGGSVPLGWGGRDDCAAVGVVVAGWEAAAGDGGDWVSEVRGRACVCVAVCLTAR